MWYKLYTLRILQMGELDTGGKELAFHDGRTL